MLDHPTGLDLDDVRRIRDDIGRRVHHLLAEPEGARLCLTLLHRR